ncbi:cob(I)yrinic acid a,c-diamide adenosyltransferase [Candidatus Campbellbacteria bacterium]|nr:MAG: cob(I)yrinic acid a,c-diamide adenosyltransferase [Candidatus Campbellbacteria bacterium]
MLFTRKGDDGTSGLFGTRDRLAKDSPLFEALGTVDELNSLLGLCFATSHHAKTGTIQIAAIVRTIQEHLFIVQAELAGVDKTITPEHVMWLEQVSNDIEAIIGSPTTFLIAGGTELSGLLDVARAVSRRAERRVISARDIQAVSNTTSAYLNRLSSVLYALARYASWNEDVHEKAPSY